MTITASVQFDIISSDGTVQESGHVYVILPVDSVRAFPVTRKLFDDDLDALFREVQGEYDLFDGDSLKVTSVC